MMGARVMINEGLSTFCAFSVLARAPADVRLSKFSRFYYCNYICGGFATSPFPQYLLRLTAISFNFYWQIFSFLIRHTTEIGSISDRILNGRGQFTLDSVDSAPSLSQSQCIRGMPDCTTIFRSMIAMAGDFFPR